MTGTTQRTRTGRAAGSGPARGRVAVVAVPALVALVGYLVGLTRPALSEAEAALVWTSHRSLGEVAGLLADQDAGSGGYPLFLHLWLRGEASEFWARLPSAIAMALAVAVTADLARRWWGAQAAAAAGLLLAVSPTTWRYAQDVQPYAAATLLAVLSGWLLLRASERRRWSWWAGYSVCLTLLGLVQPTALLVVLAHPLLLAAARQRNWRQWLWSAIDGLVLPALLVVIASVQANRSPRSPAQEHGGPDQVPGLADLIGGYAEAAGGLPYAALVGAAAVLGVVGSREFPALLAWFTLPPLVLGLLGLAVPGLFQPSALVFCGPALVLMAAAGVRKAVGWQVALVCALAAALAAPALWRLHP